MRIIWWCYHRVIYETRWDDFSPTYTLQWLVHKVFYNLFFLSKSPAKSYIKKLLLRYSSDDMMIASKRRGLRDWWGCGAWCIRCMTKRANKNEMVMKGRKDYCYHHNGEQWRKKKQRWTSISESSAIVLVEEARESMGFGKRGKNGFNR